MVLVTSLAITAALRATLEVYEANHPESRLPTRVSVQATGVAPAPREGHQSDKRRQRHFGGGSDASMAHSLAQLFEGQNR